LTDCTLYLDSTWVCIVSSLLTLDPKASPWCCCGMVLWWTVKYGHVILAALNTIWLCTLWIKGTLAYLYKYVICAFLL
jgi:hypothetical protein